MRRLALGLMGLGVVLTLVGVVGSLADSDGGDETAETTETTEVTGPTEVPEPTGPDVEDPVEDNPGAAVAGLYAELEQAAAAGDVEGLLQRLHPGVVDLYGAEQCREFLGNFARARPTFTVESASGPEPFDFERDGRVVPVGDAFTAQIVVTAGGQSTEPQEAHVAEVDDTFRWFTDCGDPL